MATSASQPSSGSAQPAVQRQIVLPLSKAVEIAWKNIRMRLSRSLLVTSGIVLALAFLMSIRTSDAMINGMRAWRETAAASPQFQALRQRQAELEKQVRALDDELRAAAAKPPALPAGTVNIDPKDKLGADLADIQKELGTLPGVTANLVTLMTADGQYIGKMAHWMRLQRDLKAVKDQLKGPDQLKAIMANEGVPTTEQEIAANRVQTRWLLGLALLVAFVGILNAMLMSVTERFREIGTMKCLGALDTFIVKLFLIESLFQGIIGTLLGILAGLLLSLLGLLVSYGSFAWQNVPVSAILASAAMCFAVGVGLTVAGAVYPAWQAARMAPVEAMRVET